MKVLGRRLDGKATIKRVREARSREDGDDAGKKKKKGGKNGRKGRRGARSDGVGSDEVRALSLPSLAGNTCRTRQLAGAPALCKQPHHQHTRRSSACRLWRWRLAGLDNCVQHSKETTPRASHPAANKTHLQDDEEEEDVDDDDDDPESDEDGSYDDDDEEDDDDDEARSRRAGSRASGSTAAAHARHHAKPPSGKKKASSDWLLADSKKARREARKQGARGAARINTVNLAAELAAPAWLHPTPSPAAPPAPPKGGAGGKQARPAGPGAFTGQPEPLGLWRLLTTLLMRCSADPPPGAFHLDVTLNLLMLGAGAAGDDAPLPTAEQARLPAALRAVAAAWPAGVPGAAAGEAAAGGASPGNALAAVPAGGGGAAASQQRLAEAATREAAARAPRAGARRLLLAVLRARDQHGVGPLVRTHVPRLPHKLPARWLFGHGAGSEEVRIRSIRTLSPPPSSLRPTATQPRRV